MTKIKPNRNVFCKRLIPPIRNFTLRMTYFTRVLPRKIAKDLNAWRRARAYLVLRVELGEEGGQVTRTRDERLSRRRRGRAFRTRRRRIVPGVSKSAPGERVRRTMTSRCVRKNTCAPHSTRHTGGINAQAHSSRVT